MTPEQAERVIYLLDQLDTGLKTIWTTLVVLSLVVAYAVYTRKQ